MVTMPDSDDREAWPPASSEDSQRPTTPRAIFPPVVYVPCSPLRPDDAELTVDLRPTRNGQLALLVYSALDRLVDCCGPQQPWTVMPTAELEKVRLQTGFDIVLLDLPIPEDRRRQVEVS